MEVSMKKFSVKTIVAIGIGAALFFVLASYVAIPTPIPNVKFSLQYAVLAIMSVLFGPVAGLLMGLIGHFLTDLAGGWGIWWSWVICSGLFGLVMGLVGLKLNLEEGEFSVKSGILFNVGQIVGHLVCWAVVAPILDILIYSEPSNKVFLQGLVSAGGNILTTAIVGTLLCVAYVAARPKTGSLTKEK